MAPDIWERLYPAVLFKAYIERPLCLMGIEKEDGRVLTGLAIKRLLKDESQSEWYQTLSRYTTIPNGQVKNFLVACRTYFGGKGKVRICLRGSKSGQGGGIWHIYYGALLLRSDQEVVMDCYDDCEVVDTVVHTHGTKRLTINWIAAKYLGDGSEYDVFVDDAWVPEQGIQPVQPKSEYWSLKGYKSYRDYEPFLHEQETRKFSHKREGVLVECKCMVCSVCALCSSSYTQYEEIRTMLSTFGHEVQCLSGSYAHYDQVVKGQILRRVLTHPSVGVFKPAEMRASVVLQNELPLQHPTPMSLQYDPDSKKEVQIMKHKKGFVATKHVEVYRWLEGKKVGFFGVPPSVLGSTKIINIHNTASLARDTVDVAFFNSLAAMDMSSCAPVVYLPVDQTPASTWKPTGRSVGKFLEYEYILEKRTHRDMYYTYHDGTGWCKELPIALFDRVQDEDQLQIQQYRRFTPEWSLKEVPTNPNDFTLSVLEWRKGVACLRSPEKLVEDPSTLFWRSSQVEKEYGFFSPAFWPSSVTSYCDRRKMQISRLFIPKTWQGDVLYNYEKTSLYAMYRNMKKGDTLHRCYLNEELFDEWPTILNHDMWLHDAFLFDIYQEKMVLKRKYC